MTPRQIKTAKGMLHIVWAENNEWIFPIKTLRDECPCAGCKGETILLKTYKAEERPKTDDSYKITGIQPVGGYAIAISWKDNHDTGIYSWEYLNALKHKLEHDAAPGTAEE